MEALGSWTLALLRLLGALHCSWSWAPGQPDSLAGSYLNAAQRPLWILGDELMKRQRADRQEADYAIASRSWRRRQQRQHVPTAITIRVRPESESESESDADAESETRLVAPPLAQRHIVLPQRLQLPSHYMQQLGEARPSKPSKASKAQRRRQPQSLPIFDGAPGDNALPSASYPIFVYNGSRGELLVNTMLSAQRYPMQEPVPGQVLYPPTTPMFRPKPMVERFRLPGQQELLNLTLIPFYAHEAITAIAPDHTEDPAASAAPPTGTADEPLSLAVTTPMTIPYETQVARSKRKRKAKKVKQYNAYRSPQDVVQWQPALHSSPLEAPDNHRHYLVATTEGAGQEQPQMQMEEELQQMEMEDASQPELQQSSNQVEDTSTTTTTTTSTTSSPTTTSSSTSSFQIVYVDESLEPPADSLDSTTAAPAPLQRQSSRYALKREYYAFPVYTLGKLLQHPGRPKSHRARDLDVDCSQSGSTETEHGADNTWFILNSRYKGPHRKELTKYYTSKYTQSSPSNSRT